MSARKKLIAAFGMALCVMSLTACAEGPTDIRVTSVSDANFQAETELEWISQKPRPSIVMSKIDFTTSTDLLALARAHDFNVDFAIGPCSKDGVKQSVGPYGGVFWGKGHIYSGTKDSEVPGYKDAIAKGPPYTYTVFVEKLPMNPPQPLCLTLAGGSMMGRKLKSNDAVIPTQTRQ